MKLPLPLTCAGLLLAALAASAAATTVPITFVNYSMLPVHATAITLDADKLCRQLGIAAGSPLVVRKSDGVALPLVRDVEEGKPVVRVLAALPPQSKLELVAAGAAQWSAAPVATAQANGELNNGVVCFVPTAKGWQFGFAAERARLIEDGNTEFWVDNQNRGRISNGDKINLTQLGLAPFSGAKLESSAATLGADGRPAFTRRWKLGGLAQKLTYIETFELVPGRPLLFARVRWQNDGDAPLWIAYTGSGDGIRGRWSKDLLPMPLIERKKSPIMGDLNGGETRCAWVGGLCRITMESQVTGCGVGMSTLLPTPGKVGQGSMVWGCSGYGFQCNFIDPGVGQFPFLVKPHGSLDNGIAFLAEQTGVSVHRETVALWKALQSEKLPPLAPPCAVFVAGEPVQAQTVGGIANNADRKLALRLDFNKHFECRVTGATKLVARPLASSKKPVVLLETNQPANVTLDLNQRLGWSDEVAFVLETAAGATVAIAETLPEAPKLLSPVEGADMTDLAAMFRWCALPMVVDYQLQYARTADFAEPVDVRVTSSQDYPWYLVPDDQLPAPGRWHWRLRALKGEVAGAWSPVRSFTVNNDHATKPPKRPLTAQSPLFTLEATRVLDYTAFHPDVPADIAPFVGIIVEGMEGKGIPVTDFARGMEKLPHALMLRSHWVGLADIEWLFQHVPNFAGIQGGEHLSSLYRDAKDGDMRYHHRLTRLCAKYGMVFQEADGTYKDDKWQELMDQQGAFIRKYGPWLVLSQKNNIIRRQFYSQSAALGLWLGGITHGHGAWEDGGFYWQNAGFNGLGVCAGERSGVLRTMPRIFWDLVCVMGIARGCGLYSLDGQTLMDSAKLNARDPQAAWASSIWDDTGKTSDTFKRFVIPLIRGTVQHGLIPTKEAVAGNVKLAVFNDMKGRGDVLAWPHYAEYGPLFAATYGFRKMGNIGGQLFEFFPNTGRYYFIPALVQGNEPPGGGIRNLPLSQLQDMKKVTELFNAAYPAWYEGDAFVCRVGDTLTVLNSRENEDVTESYAVPLSAGPVTKLAGKIAPHSYLVGKVENKGAQLWLQANTEYPERDTALEIQCARKPVVLIEPATAVKQSDWDEAAKTQKLRLAHQLGAVEVLLK
jgi:hypothetical protein